MGELDGIEAGMKRRGLEALEQIGGHLLGEAQREAPKDEGTLRGSGSSRVVVEGGDAYVEVSFSTPYAARQHEETGYRHTNGKAKYLEDPLKANAARYSRILGAAIGRGL